MPKKINIEELKKKILAGDRKSLAKAITLIESSPTVMDDEEILL